MSNLELESHYCTICGLNMFSNFIRCGACNLYAHRTGSDKCIGAGWIRSRLGDDTGEVPAGDLWQCPSCASGNDTMCLFCFKSEACILFDDNNTASTECPSMYKVPTQPSKSQWVHAMCAFACNIYTADVPSKCEVCKKKDFRLVRCARQECFKAMHSSCAWKNGNLCLPTYDAHGDAEMLAQRGSSDDILHSNFSIRIFCENCTKTNHPNIGTNFVTEKRLAVCHFFELGLPRLQYVSVNMTLTPLAIKGHVPVHYWAYKWVWNATIYDVDELLQCAGVDFISKPRDAGSPCFCLGVTIDQSSGKIPPQWALLETALRTGGIFAFMTDCVPGFVTLLLSREYVESNELLQVMIEAVDFEEEDAVIIVGFEVDSTHYEAYRNITHTVAKLKDASLTGQATDPRKRTAATTAQAPIAEAPVTMTIVPCATTAVVPPYREDSGTNALRMLSAVDVSSAPATMPYSETSSLGAQSYAMQIDPVELPSKDDIVKQILSDPESWKNGAMGGMLLMSAKKTIYDMTKRRVSDSGVLDRDDLDPHDASKKKTKANKSSFRVGNGGSESEVRRADLNGLAMSSKQPYTANGSISIDHNHVGFPVSDARRDSDRGSSESSRDRTPLIPPRPPPPYTGGDKSAVLQSVLSDPESWKNGDMGGTLLNSTKQQIFRLLKLRVTDKGEVSLSGSDAPPAGNSAVKNSGSSRDPPLDSHPKTSHSSAPMYVEGGEVTLPPLPPEQLYTRSNSIPCPAPSTGAGRGRGRAQTMPAWMTNDSSAPMDVEEGEVTLLPLPPEQLYTRSISIPCPAPSAGAGRGRGRAQTMPAWMTNA